MSCLPLTLASFWSGVIPWRGLHLVRWKQLLPFHRLLPLCSWFATLRDLWIVEFCACPRNLYWSMWWVRCFLRCAMSLLTSCISASRICSSLPVFSTALCSSSLPVLPLSFLLCRFWRWTYACWVCYVGFPWGMFRYISLSGVAGAKRLDFDRTCVFLTSHGHMSRIYTFETDRRISICYVLHLTVCATFRFSSLFCHTAFTYLYPQGSP